MKRKNTRSISTAALVLVFAIMACSIGQGDNAPTVIINSPVDGATVILGQELIITSTSSSELGIHHVELFVNDIVASTDAPPDGNPNSVVLNHAWTPTALGSVIISLVAYDVTGVISPPAMLTITVVSAAAGLTPEDTPPTAATPTGSSPGDCPPLAELVSDVTIPDNTNMSPGNAFTKIWQVRNTGGCDWPAGYQILFVSGDQMNGAAVSLSPVAVGATQDVGVNLTAPFSPGTYIGTWRLRSGDGTVFGPNMTVVIIVLAADTVTPVFPSATLVPTATMTMPPTVLIPGLTLIPVTFVVIFPYVDQVFEQTTIPANSTGSVTATCPGSSIVTGGGFAVSVDVYIYTHSINGNGWRVYAKNNTGSSKTLNAYAICLYNSGGSTSQQLNQVTAPANNIGHAVATCPGGSVVTGGGYASNSSGNLYVYNSSRSGNGWQVYADNFTGSGKLLNAYAICLSGTTGVTSQVVNQQTLPAGDADNSTANCASGLVTGGGFAGTDELWFYNTSMTSDESGWETYAVNQAGSSKLLNSYAICLTFP